jgi:uncharacterized protein YlxW (UPF0749 family)
MASLRAHRGAGAYLESATTGWGQTKDAYRRAVDSVTDNDQLRADLVKLMDDVETIRRERNKLAHSRDRRSAERAGRLPAGCRQRACAIRATGGHSAGADK